MLKKKQMKAASTQAIIPGGCILSFMTVLTGLLKLWYAHCGLTTWDKGKKVWDGKFDCIALMKQLIVDWIAAGANSLS